MIEVFLFKKMRCGTFSKKLTSAWMTYRDSSDDEQKQWIALDKENIRFQWDDDKISDSEFIEKWREIGGGSAEPLILNRLVDITHSSCHFYEPEPEYEYDLDENQFRTEVLQNYEKYQKALKVLNSRLSM